MNHSVTRARSFRKLFIRLSFCLPAMLTAEPADAAPPSGHAVPAEYHRKLRQAALVFTENRGQVADREGRPRPEVLFTAHSGNARVFLTATGIYYQFDELRLPENDPHDARPPKDPARRQELLRQAKARSHRFRLSLEGANPAPRVRKEQQESYTENFYLSHCPQGITGVHTYSRVVLEEVYPGIDWVLYAGKDGLKYDFVVRPGADPARIRLAVADADEAAIDGKGGLVMKTSLGEVREAAPVAACDNAPVAVSFRQSGPGLFGFALGEWDRTRTLIIDPAVTWATYYGAADAELGGYCTVDASGNVYLAGYTNSVSGMASAGGLQPVNAGGMEDAYLVKFTSTGARNWATYYGGTDWDDGSGCTTDGAGNVYLLGWTNSTAGIATAGAYRPTIGGAVDVFIARFNSAGVRSWATYYGGSSNDYPYGCTTDGAGNLIISGNTLSPAGIATAGAYQTTRSGTQDNFLARFSSAGTLLWGTYFGGSGQESVGSCALDGAGNIFLTGATTSTSGIATAGTFQTAAAGSTDGYVAKFSSAGALLWGTYFGGPSNDYINGCAEDRSGNIYIAGYTTGSTSGISSPGAVQSAYTSGDEGIVAKFSAGGARLWATYLGGTGQDRIYECAADAAGSLYVVGLSSSGTNIATPGALRTSRGGTDALLVKYNGNGTRSWGTYYGGSNWDEGDGVAVDGSGNLYLSGNTSSTADVATPGAFQPALSGGYDGYVAKFSQVTANILPAPAYCAGAAINVPFTSSTTAGTGNVYTAQLSNASGSFASGTTTIGTLSSTATAGTIAATLPASAGYGAGYRIRIISSNPVDTGGDNGVDIAINGRLYVDASSAAWGTGSSWSSPLKTVDSALRIANRSSCGQEIWVRQGTYYPMAGTAIAASRDSSLRILRNGIRMYGGFGGNDTTMATRNPTAHPTVLSGDIGAANDSTDNSFHVLTVVATLLTPIDTTTLINGFTITRGNATGSGSFTVSGIVFNQQDGAGIYIAGLGTGNSAGLKVAGCTFTRNTANNGGGIYMGGYGYGASAAVADSCLFIQNTAIYYGGGIASVSEGLAGVSVARTNSLWVRNSTFSGNTTINMNPSVSLSGGACLYYRNSNVAMTGSTISGNTSPSAPGIKGEGGRATVTGCSFTGNAGTDASLSVWNLTSTGQTYVPGSGPADHAMGDTAIYTSCIFSGNSANFGGGIVCYNLVTSVPLSLVLSGCTFTGNTAGIGSGFGGALFVSGAVPSSITINNRTLITGNSAISSGGGIYISQGSGTATALSVLNSVISNNTISSGNGAGIRLITAGARITQSIIANNSCTSSTGGSGGIHLTDGTLTMHNVTMSGNNSASAASFGASLYADATATLNINNTIISGTAAPHVVAAGTMNYDHVLIRGASLSAPNLSADPMFTDASNPAGADGLWGTADDGLRLQRCSPAIDAGNNAIVPAGLTTDFGGGTRIQLPRIDLGAYEYTGSNILSVTASGSNPNCGANDGSITISGLTAGITYTVNYVLNGSTQPALTLTAGAGGTIVLSNLAAGSYTNISVVFGSCVSNLVTGPVVLTSAASPSVSSVTGANPTSCGGTDGSLTINGLVPSASGYTITYFNGSSTVTLNSQTASASGTIVIGSLPAGSYSSFTVSRSGCTGNFAGPVTLSSPATPAAPIVSGNGPVCAGNAINLSASAVAGAAYSWTGPNGFTSALQNPSVPAATAAATGTYTATVTVAGCTSLPGSASITVNPTPALIGASGTNPTTCNGTNGSVTLTGLTPAASYTIGYTRGGAAQTPVTLSAGAGGTVTLNGLSAGSYSQFTATLGSCSSAALGTVITLTDPAKPAPPAISSNSPVCAGSSLLLTGPALSGVTYSWTGPNGFTAAVQSPVISNATIAATGSYSLVITNTATGCSSSPAGLSATVNPIPAVTSISSTNPLTCNGTSGTITLNGLTPNVSYTISYQQTTGSGGNPTTVTRAATAGGTIVLTGLTAGTYAGMTLTLAGCSSQAGAIAAVTLNDPPVPAAPVATANSPVCQGSSLILNAAGQAGAAYSWSGPNSYTSSIQNPTVTSNMQGIHTGTYSVTQTVAGCTSAAATTTVSMTALPAAAGSITGAVSPCASGTQTYSIAPVNGATGYSWTLPAGWTITSAPANANTITVTTGTTTGQGTLRVAPVNGCGPGQAATLTVTTVPVAAPSVSVTASAGVGNPPANVLCQGAADTFRAAAVNGGPAPLYQWKKNGVNVGAGGDTYIDNTLNNGDMITVTMTSSLPCVTLSQVSAQAVRVTVSPLVVPGININTTPPTTFCEGTPLLFFTNINGGGPNPAYQWYRNGAPITGQTGPTYTGSGNNGDTLTVRLTSNAACASPATAMSNKIGLTANPIVVPSVTVTASTAFPVVRGTQVTFTATPVNGGTAPAYQWKKNGVNIPLATGPTYTTNSLRDGDRITVELRSAAPCATLASVLSPAVNVSVLEATGVHPSPAVGPMSVTLYPNPNTGRFTISMEDPAAAAGGRIRIDVLDALGRIIHTREIAPASGSWSQEISLGDQVANGNYMVRIAAADGLRVAVRQIAVNR